MLKIVCVCVKRLEFLLLFFLEFLFYFGFEKMRMFLMGLEILRNFGIMLCIDFY